MYFPYIGNIINANSFMDIAINIPDHDYIARCSALEDITTKHKPGYEDKNYTYYNSHNSIYYEHKLDNCSLLDENFFLNIQAKKEGHVAKIMWSNPGNTEPPHVDWFPSFVGSTKSDGSPWTQEDAEDNRKRITRVWIPLLDSEIGHILYGDAEALTVWEAGDAFRIVPGSIHGFTNAGRNRRYVLVVTAWLK
tara:strand:- start:935 stop:1513 length:579 start_codon:yes stop_codon:yes gene_type:complete